MRAEEEKVERRAKREGRALKRREAWFEAEKRGENGDKVVREMEIEDEGEETSEEGDVSSDD